MTVCVLLTGPALAQSLGEKTGVNSALGITPKTADFVSEAASGDMFEIESSKLAAQKGNDQVRQFANQMVTDHTKTSNELKAKTQQANVSVPSEMSSSQQRMIEKLRGLEGNDFSKQYADDQVTAHKDAVSLFERYGKGGDSAELKAWATGALPTLQHHLEMAQQLPR
jgi:putative membrane protein